MSEKVKAYKGFNVTTYVYNKETETFENGINCRGFKFKEGKTYEESKAKLCKCGFHACTYPLDVFNYYYGMDTEHKFEYHIVELEDVSPEQEFDSKICAKKITIGKKITPVEMVEISKTFPAIPVERTNNGNITSCFFIKDDVTKAEPIVGSMAAFGCSKCEINNYNCFYYFHLLNGKFESSYTRVYLPDLENYSFWKGVPTQEELEGYYRYQKRG